MLNFGVVKEKTIRKGADGGGTLRISPVSEEAGGQDRTGIMDLTLPAALRFIPNSEV